MLGDSSIHYNKGQKRCGICDIFLICEKSKCPCCNAILHVRPSHSKDKIKYFKKHGTKWI